VVTEYFYRRYAEEFYTTAFVLLTPACGEMCQDAVHETFADFFTALRRKRIRCLEGCIRADLARIARECRQWLLTSLKTRCLRIVIRERSCTQLVPVDLREFARYDPRPSPEEQLAQREMRERLHRLVNSLPAILRDVVVLRELKELSIEETADTLALTNGTVQSRLARARVLLKRYLEGIYDQA
jgi:RNA polymerase sigma-70 factor (ECF subfamily)